MGTVGASIERPVRKNGVPIQGYPFGDMPVTGGDGGSALVALADDLVEVVGSLGAEALQGEVVDNQ